MAEVTELNESILDSTKQSLLIPIDYNVFDNTIIIHINSVFTTLNQLGVGPPQGFSIKSNETKWNDYLDSDLNLNAVQSYMYLRVRLLFDLPTNSFTITAFKEQIKELEWRLQVQADPPPSSYEEDV